MPPPRRKSDTASWQRAVPPAVARLSPILAMVGGHRRPPTLHAMTPEEAGPHREALDLLGRQADHLAHHRVLAPITQPVLALDVPVVTARTPSYSYHGSAKISRQCSWLPERDSRPEM